ncbi:SOCS box domain,SH2 domain [Cinara cedri]|uniref:SOCS box domain,SH2 domain n=1 Tax=Cinara cedri TaxID=506608 RepID=A0A5E4NH84_9HEMI|nr:SOCS box domain,SH2 domain [Cinara cedri]
MLNTSCRETDTRPGNDNDAVSPPVAVLQDPDKSMRLQACWIRLWDRWASEQRILVLYQMHINHVLSRERSKLTLAGGRVVTCRRVKHQHHQQSSGGDGGVRSHPLRSWSDATANIAAAAVPDSFASMLPVVVGGPPDLAADARDLRVLSSAVDRLRGSGWYYEGARAQAWTANALASMPPGRFCVRDSKHSEHLFTMDVHTGGGNIVSVRFTYADGLFGLDSMRRHSGRGGALSFPKFRCPIELLDYYVRLSRIEAARRTLVYSVWVDGCGQLFSWMNLCRPMVKVDPVGFPSLKHMARLVINRHKCLITITPTSLPNELIEYLLQYPYSL